jgi:hypothetical protein
MIILVNMSKLDNTLNIRLGHPSKKRKGKDHKV